ncbi:MAG: hypothetical protein GF311_19010 [Candidatus Lokiarchaeota archaeon]|nr:hypothetical protein [Candidatus Lokiarchaeota archaeon]
MNNDGITESGYVRIYVNNTLYANLYSEIAQYQQDLENQGFNAEIINWSDPVVENLKGDLINSQNSTFVGAVLIGKIPYANYEMGGAVFPCDLYLMDLDGVWGDLSGVVGAYDNHFGGGGDVYPEIWIGRINPEKLNNIGSHLQAYKDYFNRNHAYRDSSLYRPHSALVYVDYDWTDSNAVWHDGVKKSYSNTTLIGVNATTNDIDYESRIQSTRYELIHAMIHSTSTQHQFYSGGSSAGITTNTEINALTTNPLFYNLYCCSACDFRVINNIGTQYLFSSNSLCVIGSTKSGGMLMISYFYTPLGKGYSIGESFRQWWSNPLHGPDDSYSQGLCILGDPLLTI